MISLETLQEKTTEASLLQEYLSDNFEKIYDFFQLQKHSELLDSKEELKRYISLNWLIINQLDKKDKTNLSFLTLLLEVCDRLGLRAQFKLLHDFLITSQFDIGDRLKASSLYLININTVDDYLNRYDSIIELLQSSYETEEDNKDKVLTTIINYYSQVLIDFGQFNLTSVIELKEKIEITISENNHSFLNHTLIESVLGIELTEHETAYKKIHFLLDSYIGRDIIKPKYNSDYLLESNTEYAEILANVALNFNKIRQISVEKYNIIRNDTIYYSLQRGVKVLTEESQLYAYMYSFGNMHFEKLNTSFEYLPKSLFNEELNIIDWACGQAVASMTYLEYLSRLGNKQIYKNVTLIEPSEIALRRGALHVKKYLPNTNINTINKDLDSLSVEDFLPIKNNSNLHLFSNILDIDLFSLTNLIQQIQSSFNGINYFVCVSPYVNDLKTNRLDTFMTHFSRFDGFEEFISINNKTGQWIGNWTRVTRVFKANIA